MTHDALFDASMCVSTVAEILRRVDFAAVDRQIVEAMETPSCRPVSDTEGAAIGEYLRRSRAVFAAARALVDAQNALDETLTDVARESVRAVPETAATGPQSPKERPNEPRRLYIEFVDMCKGFVGGKRDLAAVADALIRYDKWCEEHVQEIAAAFAVAASVSAIEDLTARARVFEAATELSLSHTITAGAR